MNNEAFLLVLASGVLHALWNIATHQVSGNLKTLWFSLVLAASVYGLILIPTLSPGQLSSTVLFCITATALIHALYFYLLCDVYRLSDLSFVYPLSRAAAILLATIGARLFFQEEPNILQFWGIGLVFAGIVLLALSRRKTANYRRELNLVLLVGLLIASAAVIDRVAVRELNPFFYIWVIFAGASLLLAVPVLRLPGRGVLAEVAGQKLYVLLLGPTSMLTYLLILFAFRLDKLSHIAAVREVSIIISALVGIIFLKERGSLLKILGIAVALTGIFFIKTN